MKDSWKEGSNILSMVCVCTLSLRRATAPPGPDSRWGAESKPGPQGGQPGLSTEPAGTPIASSLGLPVEPWCLTPM